MSDEIKEILEILKKCYDLKDEYFDNYISLYQLGLLLDYITNLQEENTILKENAEHNDKVVDKARWNEMIYKSRCEKGIAICDEMLEVLYSYTDRKVFEDIKDSLIGGDKSVKD